MADAGWFAGRLRELRAAAGLTQRELAERAGVSQRGLAQWEIGRREPGWRSVLALAEALGVDCTAFARPPGKLPPPRPGRPPKARGAPAAEPRRRRGRRGK
jgi:transcriptional regulator with XRE-family HTH domain